MSGRGCIDMIYYARQLVGRAREHNTQIFRLFIELRRGYSSIYLLLASLACATEVRHSTYPAEHHMLTTQWYEGWSDCQAISLLILSKQWRRSRIAKQLPSERKKSILVPVHKKDRKTCENYHGISLSSTLGKVLSLVLVDRLDAIIDLQLMEAQCGFWKE